MEKISSSLTGAMRILAPTLALGLTVLSATLAVPIAMRAGILVFALLTGWNWWRYFRRCQEVFLSSESLLARISGNETIIPFRAIRSVTFASFIRFPPILVTFESPNGLLEQLVFIPSHRKFWSPLGRQKVERLVQRLNATP
jgi:hypothetical protein